MFLSASFFFIYFFQFRVFFQKCRSVVEWHPMGMLVMGWRFFSGLPERGIGLWAMWLFWSRIGALGVLAYAVRPVRRFRCVLRMLLRV
jgi:hypothetical protein